MVIGDYDMPVGCLLFPLGTGPIADAITFNPDAVAFNDNYLGYRYLAASNALAITIQSLRKDQYHLYGRLLKPLEEIGRADINAWLAAHPGGRVVVYLKKAGDMAQVRPEFGQHYLEGAVVLVDAESAKRLEGLRL